MIMRFFNHQTRRGALLAAGVTLLAGCTGTLPVMPASDRARLEQQVADTERAFARTMADRDHAAFTALLSDEAVFFTGPTPLRGKAAVAAFWKRFYEAPTAPFSWQPKEVQVLDSGTLALSSGPVEDAKGNQIAVYTSVWRQESPGVWRIVFDRGCQCREGKPF